MDLNFFGKSRPLAVIRRKTKFFRFKKFSDQPFEAQKGAISLLFRYISAKIFKA
jgi:hypothetical protein